MTYLGWSVTYQCSRAQCAPPPHCAPLQPPTTPGTSLATQSEACTAEFSLCGLHAPAFFLPLVTIMRPDAHPSDNISRMSPIFLITGIESYKKPRLPRKCIGGWILIWINYKIEPDCVVPVVAIKLKIRSHMHCPRLLGRMKCLFALSFITFDEVIDYKQIALRRSKEGRQIEECQMIRHTVSSFPAVFTTATWLA